MFGNNSKSRKPIPFAEYQRQQKQKSSLKFGGNKDKDTSATSLKSKPVKPFNKLTGYGSSFVKGPGAVNLSTYKGPIKTGRADGRGFGKSADGRYIGNSRGKGPVKFQLGRFENAGRDRGTRFVPYKPPVYEKYVIPPEEKKVKEKPAAVEAPVDTTDPRYPNPDGPQPRPPADTISPGPRPGPPDGDGGGRALRIRESAARRTAFSRGKRARGSRRSARVGAQRAGNRLGRSVSGLGKSTRSRVGINV